MQSPTLTAAPLPETPPHTERCLAPVPEGFDALFLARAARPDSLHVHIARSPVRLEQLADAIGFFAPDVPILRFPAWDSLPYDRVSPDSEIVSERLRTLATLARTGGKGAIVLTIPQALLQKCPPRAFFQAASLHLAKGGRVEIKALRVTLAANGYFETATVREPGEFAIRGGLVDIFPPGFAEPVRLDLFGDEIESLRTFDPVSQLTTGTATGLTLEPAREVLLNDETIQRFRQGYRLLAKPPFDSDPLYAAVSAGQVFPGLEHWLPLFYDQLASPFTYFANATLTLDSGARDGLAERATEIAEYYQARLQALTRKGDAKGAYDAAYYPVAPDSLYLPLDAAIAALTAHTPLTLDPLRRAYADDSGAQPGETFAAARQDPARNLYAEVLAHARSLQKDKRKVVIAAYSEGSKQRLIGVLRQAGEMPILEAATWAEALQQAPKALSLVVAPLTHGFAADGVAVLTEQDILGDKLGRRAKRRKADAFIREASSLNQGDFVVHQEHGIGQYDGIETLQVTGAAHDCVKVLYAGGDKLFVPVENIEILSRFGSIDSAPPLDKLGGAAWQARKAKVKERIQAIADDLLRIAAERTLREGEALAPEGGLYDEFCARFPYVETDDQLNAIADVLTDLASGRPMDRLICGDVGFGKTEVAMRAAFIAAMQGLQVAVICPTTLLARQHYLGFQARLAGFPLRIAQLSRLVSAKDATQVKDQLRDGQLDIVVGTHALLAKGIHFKNLGLVIVDEEQHFGVAQKEKLKQFKANVHLLTLSATPIPRTLQMALSGVRDMSIIATPPVDRLAVRTFITPYDGVVLREALLREHMRGGQTFYVCPRIKDLAEVAEKLTALVPELKVQTAHGQIAAGHLEDIMTGFVNREFDILLSTQIIESGIDIPAANTLIIHNSHLFGLAQLYQLRGRVGRSKAQAYAYLTLPPQQHVAKSALRRLEVMQTLDHLGAGFTLASHDMDIRGAGNLLGEEQSGHIREVGVELYQQMLDEAVSVAKAAARAAETDTVATAPAEGWSPVLQLGMPVLIPERYVSDLDVRMSLYRRAAGLLDEDEIQAFTAELIDRFGPLPEPVENLLTVIRLKRACVAAGVARVDAGPKGVVVGFHNNTFAAPDKLLAFIAREKGTVKLRPDQKVVFLRVLEGREAVLKGIRGVLEVLQGLL